MSVLIALLVALTLVVSGAPTAHADPDQPGDSPTISAIEPGDEADPPELDLSDPPEAEDVQADGLDGSVVPDAAEGALKIVWPQDVGVLKASPSGLIVPPFSEDAVNDATYQSQLRGAGWLPDKYTEDLLRNNDARDQGHWGTCWAFAALTSGASSLVRSGEFSGYEPASQRYLSPLHLVQSVYFTKTFKANTAKPLADNGPYKGGGTHYMAAAAMSHFYGPQKESKHPYPEREKQNVAPKLLTATQLKSSAYRLHNMYVLPTPRDSGGTYRPANVETIKEAIYFYGVAYATMSTKNIDSTAYWNDIEKSFYDNTFGVITHAVTIIGWDDTFAASRFKIAPGGPGAFLIMNSWGKTKDFFWLSYYDTTLGSVAVFELGGAGQTPEHRSAYEWNRQYSHDQIGMGNGITNSTNTITYANRYTVKANSSLRAVQIGTWAPNMNYKVEVYVGNIKATSATAGGSAKALTPGGDKYVSGFFTYAGYNLVTLDKPVLLKKNQKFSIVVTLTAPPGQEAQAPMEMKMNYGAGYDTLTLSAGQSFLKHNGKWIDVKTLYKSWGSTGKYGNFNIIGLASASPKYMLMYNPNGGTVAKSYKTVTYGGKVGTLAKPTRTGYTFSGWYSQPIGGTKYTSTKVYNLADDMYVYAHWKAKKYTVTFNANGGATPKSSGKATTSKTVTFASSYGALPTTTRAGYTFAGWWTAKVGGVEITSASMVNTAKAHTLYARWV